MPNGLWNVGQAATFLNVSRPTVYRLVRDGMLPSVKVRGRRMFRPADLSRYISALPVASGSTADQAEVAHAV